MNAFEVIYRACSGFVYNVALRVTGNLRTPKRLFRKYS